MLSKASRGYLEAAVGQHGAKRRPITVKILICDGVLMNDTIVVFPLQ
jgi:hypothetical protein